MDYDQDFIGLEGYNFPENGNRIFQEDFKNEQEAVGQEVIDRESDLFTRGVITGGEVTASATSGCIDIAAVLARDTGGRRIYKTSQNAFAVPDGQTVKIIVRHVWSYSGYVPDGSGGQVSSKRTHSAEFGYIPDAQEPEDGEVLLRRVSRSGSAVTIRDDLRSYSKLKSLTLMSNYYEEVGMQNLVYNGIFRWFNNKIGTGNWYDYKHPDGWTFTDNGTDGKIGWNSTDEYCKMISSSDGSSMSFKQSIHDFPRWQRKLKGKKVTIKIHIKGASSTIVKMYDGVNTVQQALLGTGSIEIIQLQLTVDTAATGLHVEVINMQQSQTIEIQKAYGNTGECAIETFPCIIDEKIGQFHVQGNLTVDGELEGNAFDKIIQAAIDAIYDVGDIYITTDDTSPATKYGGTWSVFGAGKTLVSLDSGDTDFDTVEETRGAKTHTLSIAELAPHTHSGQGGQNLHNGYARPYAGGDTSVYCTWNTTSTGSGTAHNNIQPSIVVKMWKRTA